MDNFVKLPDNISDHSFTYFDPDAETTNTSFTTSEFQLDLQRNAVSTYTNTPAEGTPLVQAENFQVQFDMAAEKISIPKFSGLSSEDPKKFLETFQSYSLLYNPEGDDARKLAAFHLRLSGPALIWFQTISVPEDQAKTWKVVHDAFLTKYINIDNNPVLLAEAELFQQMTLAPSQPLEEYHSLLVEKGTRLEKSARDILPKFIAGLPQQLGFFVRARGPTDHTSALTEALVGEAHGYRLMTSEPPTVSSAMPLVPTSRTSEVPKQASDGLAALQAQMAALAQKIDNIERPTRRDRARRDRDSTRSRASPQQPIQ